jgi:hypothetical protein
VIGLGPEDFRVEVDGRPRRLVSVEYVGRELEPATAPPARPAHFSSNEDAARGRLVLLLVDRGNIGRGGGREVFKAASRFLGGLAPADRVGLAFIPGPGSGIEFTADVEDVRRGLSGVVGTATRAGHKVPLAEAVAKIKMNDRMRWQEFLVLQCRGSLPEELTGPWTRGGALRLAQVAVPAQFEQDAGHLLDLERSLDRPRSDDARGLGASRSGRSS